MARLLFEMQAVRTRRGPLAAGTVFVVYTDAAGTALADISATVGGSAIAGSTVTVADIPGLGPSALRFYGPTDNSEVLYLRCPSDSSLGVQEIEADATSGGGGAHPNLATHDALGLATDTELAAHAAGAAHDTILPGDLPALFAWYDASRITGLADGAAVATWSDLSGNGRHATQATAGNRPTYQTSEINSLPAVLFDGSDMLSTAAFTALPKTTIFAVVKLTSTAGSVNVVDGNAGRHQLGYRSGSWEMYQGTALTAGPAADTTAHVLAATFTGAAGTHLAVDGVLAAASNAGTHSLDQLLIGANPPVNEPLSGYVAEVVVYSRNLSTTEREQVELYLARKWGTTRNGAGFYPAIALRVADSGLWVSTVGNNSYDGLSAGTAKLTVQAALDALPSAGGVVNVLGGTFSHTAELSARGGDGPVTVRGMGTGIDASVSRLVWPTDLGAGQFAFKNSVDSATQKICLEDLLLEGPTASGLAYGGVGAAAMSGVRLNRRMEARDCRIRGFHAGVNIVQDHNRLERCEISGNRYGVYWSDMDTYGDHLIYDCNLSGNWLASMAVAPTGVVLGTVVFRGHLGFCPYSILLENGRDANSACLGTVLFYDVSFEYAGNGHIISHDQTAKLQNVVFESSGTWSMADEYAIIGQDAPAIIMAGLIETCRFYNAFPRPGERLPTLAGIVANTMETNTIDGSFLAGFIDFTDNNVPLFQAKLAINNVWRDATNHGYITKAKAASAGVGAGQVVGWGSAADRDYVLPYSAAWTANADAPVAGVALTTGPAANEAVLQNCVVVATEGFEVLALTTAATPSAGVYLMVDPADRDKVTTSDGRLDLPLLGPASGSQSGTTSGTNCKVDLHPPRPSGVRRKTVTGIRGTNAALADLLTELAALGLITDSTTET